MNKDEQDKFVLFSRIGMVTLSILLLIGLGVNYVPKMIETSVKSTDRKLPIYCVDNNENKVSLSFDAAWGNEDTADILKILDQYNVKVTFFMTGGWVEKYPDDVKAIAAAGHDLGNHSENHKQMSTLSKEECKEELMKPHNKVKELTGKDMILFRPPYGDYNNTVIEVANENGYHCIQWDVDTFDIK